MFKWIKKALFKRKINKRTVAHISYVLGTDGFVYIDFGWDNKKDKIANESFIPSNHRLQKPRAASFAVF